MGKISNVFKNLVNPKQQKLHILVFADHDHDIDYNSIIYKTDNNFFIINNVDLQEEDKKKIPKNCFLLPKGMLMHSLSYDLVLVNNRLGNDVLSAQELAEKLSLPVAVFTDKKPPSDLTPKYLKMLEQHGGDVNIFLTENIKSSWNVKKGASIALTNPVKIKDIQNILKLISEGIYS